MVMTRGDVLVKVVRRRCSRVPRSALCIEAKSDYAVILFILQDFLFQ